MVDVTLFDPDGANVFRISNNGELVVGDYDHSDSYYVSATTTEPFEIVEGKPHMEFIIMAFWVAATKSVSPSTAATIDIYEADRHDLGTALKIKASIDLTSGQIFSSPSRLRMATCEGCSLVVTTDDPTVNVTIVGYYEPPR